MSRETRGPSRTSRHVPRGLNQSTDCPAHREIIINDGNQPCDVVHGFLGLKDIVLQGTARDMGPWSSPTGSEPRSQRRDAHKLTAMAPASPASWTRRHIVPPVHVGEEALAPAGRPLHRPSQALCPPEHQHQLPVHAVTHTEAPTSPDTTRTWHCGMPKTCSARNLRSPCGICVPCGSCTAPCADRTRRQRAARGGPAPLSM